jgi:hypothetical protein
MDINTMRLEGVDALEPGNELDALVNSVIDPYEILIPSIRATNAIEALECIGYPEDNRHVIHATLTAPGYTAHVSLVHLDERMVLWGDDVWSQHEVWSTTGDDWALTICKGIVAWAICRRGTNG